MNENNSLIDIDELHLQETIHVCQQEQQVHCHHTNRLFPMILRFIKFDLRLYFFTITLSLATILSLILWDVEQSQAYILFYFIFLGTLGIFEYYKSIYYKMEDIVFPVYLNPSRVLFLKSCCIALFELGIFLFLCILLSSQDHSVLLMITMTSIIPLYCIQIFLLQFLHAIKGYVSSLLLYFGIYGLYYFVYLEFLQSKMTTGRVLMCFIVILLLYSMKLWSLYKKTNIQGGNHYGVSRRTY